MAFDYSQEHKDYYNALREQNIKRDEDKYYSPANIEPYHKARRDAFTAAKAYREARRDGAELPDPAPVAELSAALPATPYAADLNYLDIEHQENMIADLTAKAERAAQRVQKAVADKAQLLRDHGLVDTVMNQLLIQAAFAGLPSTAKEYKRLTAEIQRAGVAQAQADTALQTARAAIAAIRRRMPKGVVENAKIAYDVELNKRENAKALAEERKEVAEWLESEEDEGISASASASSSEKKEEELYGAESEDNEPTGFVKKGDDESEGIDALGRAIKRAEKGSHKRKYLQIERAKAKKIAKDLRVGKQKEQLTAEEKRVNDINEAVGEYQRIRDLALMEPPNWTPDDATLIPRIDEVNARINARKAQQARHAAPKKKNAPIESESDTEDDVEEALYQEYLQWMVALNEDYKKKKPPPPALVRKVLHM